MEEDPKRYEYKPPEKVEDKENSEIKEENKEEIKKEPKEETEKTKETKDKNWEEVVKPHKEKKKSRKWVFAVVIIVAFAAGFVIMNPNYDITGMITKAIPTDMPTIGNAESVEEGDTVSVRYAGRLEDGTLFDTNIEEVAIQEGMEKAAYPTLDFVAGAGQMIAGFDKAVIGMKEGEKKTITIQPEDGYGMPDPTLIQDIERVQELDRLEDVNLISEIPADTFLYNFGVIEVGEEFEMPDTDIMYKVNEITETSVFVELVIEEGEMYTFPGNQWKSTIMEIGEELVTLRHEPTEGYSFEMALGDTLIQEVTEDKIIVKLDSEVGLKIPTFMGVATVIEMTEETITVDFNNELAGKVLVFDIEMVKVVKAGSSQ